MGFLTHRLPMRSSVSDLSNRIINSSKLREKLGSALAISEWKRKLPVSCLQSSMHAISETGHQAPVDRLKSNRIISDFAKMDPLIELLPKNSNTPRDDLEKH